MQSAAPSPQLLELAAAHGVATDYWDWHGNHVPVSEETLRTILKALGVTVGEPGDEDAVGVALADAELRHWRRPLPPIVVLREGWSPWVPVHLPHGTQVQMTLLLEDGTERQPTAVDHWVDPRQIDGILTGEATFELGDDLPLGWHSLTAEFADGTSATCPVVVAPDRLELPAALAEGPMWGVMSQIYQVRSADSWGIGDLSDLTTLATWAGEELGAGFVLVNPLHSAESTPPLEPSPYLPTSRRFSSPLYLRVEAIPEYADLSEAHRAEIDALAASARALNEADLIDRDAVWRLKRAALYLIFCASDHSKELERFVLRGGAGLRDFATWCALADDLGSATQYWPAALRDSRSPAVEQYRHDHEDQVLFHAWLQWQLDRQLADVQQAAAAAGMGVGIVHDLAVGVHPEGADSWGLSSALAHGVSVGAPPDQFNQLGQDWSQPPWHPERLAELGYAPYREMVRAILKDAGGLRLDHVIGLFRLWWVPDGQGPAAGAYVHYDHEAMISILLLEAHRAGAVVIGEDLGVVEPSARDYLRDRGVLGTSVLWFEWQDGHPLPAEDYRELCLATVTTHDLAPTAGYLDLAHVELRDRLGLLTRSVEEEREQEQHAISAVESMLIERGLLTEGAEQQDKNLALHRFLAATPARMRGVALSDLVGDRRIINQPGTSNEYPNWRIPLAGPDEQPMTLEQVMADDLPRQVAAAVTEESTQPE